MIKCLVYSQDEIYSKSITYCIEEVIPSGNQIICQSADEALKSLDKSSVKLALIDLEAFGDYDEGIAFMSMLTERGIDFMTFFHSDNLLRDVVQNEAFYFFMKPFSCKLLKKKLEEWLFIHDLKDTEIIELETQEGQIVLPIRNIYYFEKVNRSVKIVTKSKIYYTKESLKKISHKIDNRFYNTHQSYLVNTDKIYSIINGDSRPKRITFAGLKDEALLSRYKMKEFNDFLASR